MNLELGNDGGGPRHYLEGKPVNCGTQLLLKIEPAVPRPVMKTDLGVWVWARYEANLDPDRICVTFHTTFGRVIPDEFTFVRWPTAEEKR